MSFEIRTNCPFCYGDIEHRFKGIADRLQTTSQTFAVDECVTCQAGMLNPAPAGDVSRFYPPHYLSGEGSEPTQSRRFDLERWYRYNQYRYDFKLLEMATGTSIGSTASYVDLGCGSGERVTFAADQGCPRTVGVDKFDFAKSAAQRRADLVNSDLLDFAPDERFRTVSMFHVLEHLPDPVRILAHIKNRVLEPGGDLIVQVPNYGSLEARCFRGRWVGLDAPRHYWHFNGEVLRRLLTEQGYVVRAVYQRNAPLHPVTIVSSLFPSLDVQRIWVNRSRGAAYLRRMMALWAALTVLSIPLCVLENLAGRASMLTVVASAG
ncbi:MAG: class I SAM-dependent methyltransferase [Solirubrobacteraceae bacterium]